MLDYIKELHPLLIHSALLSNHQHCNLKATKGPNVYSHHHHHHNNNHDVGLKTCSLISTVFHKSKQSDLHTGSDPAFGWKIWCKEGTCLRIYFVWDDRL